MSPAEEGIGRRYLTETRYRRADLGGGRQPAYPRAPQEKEYPADTLRLPLMTPPRCRPADLWDCLARRRSRRQYQDRPLTLDELSVLLWASQGITLAGRYSAYRAAPSAGALYPVETYVAAHLVEEVEPGVWHFGVSDFCLELVAAGDCRRTLVEAGLSQQFLGTAGAVFIWTGVLNRSRWKYRERAIRYLFLDAGHIGQNLMLAATALGLGCCPVGAFFDEEVEQLLGVDAAQEPALYLAAVSPLA